MFDLKLNVMEEESIENLDPIQVFSDFIIAQEELNQAEQELNGINRAYENLTALQEVVAKHGWNEVLNDLVGDQVSAESLDSSCEGILDKIKGAVKKVAGATANWISKSTNILNIYLKRFKQAKEWLKKNMDDHTSSIVSSRYNSIKKSQRAYEALDIDTTYSDEKLNDNYSSGGGWNEKRSYDLADLKALITRIFLCKSVDDFKDVLGSFGDAYDPSTIQEWCKQKCNTVVYASMSNQLLLDYVDRACEHLPKVIESFNKRTVIAKNLRREENLHRKSADEIEEKYNKRKINNIREAVKEEDRYNKERKAADETREDRFAVTVKRYLLHMFIMSCKDLDNELKHRGFKSEF